MMKNFPFFISATAHPPMIFSHINTAFLPDVHYWIKIFISISNTEANANAKKKLLAPLATGFRQFL